MKPTDWLRRRSDGFWVTVVILAALVAGAVLAIVAIQHPGFRDWLIADESGSTTIRNIGLLIAAAIAMVLAVWRSRVAGRQAATAERGLLNDRFQKGAEMLGSEVLAVRIGGIYGLLHLAGEHPQQYHVQVMRLFCSFARDTSPSGILNEDAKAVMDAIGARRERDLRLERDAEYWLNLSGANLQYANLQGANLSSSDLPTVQDDVWPNRTFTDLSGAHFFDANLELAILKKADLSGAYLFGANLSGVDFTGTNLSGARLSLDNGSDSVTGLTQSQLDSARADPDNPPNLEGVVDAETGKPLVWNWGSIKAV